MSEKIKKDKKIPKFFTFSHNHIIQSYNNEIKKNKYKLTEKYMNNIIKNKNF